MRAVRVTRLEGPDAVEVAEVDEPTSAGVVIEVHAAGVAFPDALLNPWPLPVPPGAAIRARRRDRRSGSIGAG